MRLGRRRRRGRALDADAKRALLLLEVEDPGAASTRRVAMAALHMYSRYVDRSLDKKWVPLESSAAVFGTTQQTPPSGGKPSAAGDGM